MLRQSLTPDRRLSLCPLPTFSAFVYILYKQHSCKNISFLHTSAPDDYAAVNRVITFEPGTSSLSVPITINEDVIDEPQETILVDLALDTSDFDDVQLDPDRAVVNIVSVGGESSTIRVLMCNYHILRQQLPWAVITVIMKA